MAKTLPVKKVQVFSKCTGELYGTYLGVETFPQTWFLETGKVVFEKDAFSESRDFISLFSRIEYFYRDAYAMPQATRNVPDGIKKLLTIEAKQMMTYINDLLEIRKLTEKTSSYMRHLNSKFPELMAECKKLYTSEKFAQKFQEILEKNIRIPSNWRVEVGGYDNNRKLYITCEKMLEKYFRHASFLMEEYDGTIQFCNDCEKDASYKKILASNHAELPLKKSVSYKENLYLGDKDWLIYNAEYTVPLKKPLSEEYLSELIKTIV